MGTVTVTVTSSSRDGREGCPTREQHPLCRGELGTFAVWPAAGVCRNEIGGQTVLFSEDAQKFVSLNEAAAIVWDQLASGLPLDQLAGGDRRAAIVETIEVLARNGLIRRAENMPPAEDFLSNASAGSRTFEIGLTRIGLSLDDGILGATVWPRLKHFEAPQRKAQINLSVLADASLLSSRCAGSGDRAERRPAFHVLREQSLLFSCAADEIGPALRVQLTAEVLDHGAYALALHAAALVVDERLLLITGPPGAGKSTLAVGLLSNGFGFAADDLVLLDGDGVARGIPFWPSLKEGSWKLVEDFLPEIACCATHRRPDGRHVRYVRPSCPISGLRYPVGWVVSLSGPRSPAGLVPDDPLRTFEALLSGAYSPDSRLSTAGFRALAALMRNARCFSLGNLPFEAAVAAICEACV